MPRPAAVHTLPFAIASQSAPGEMEIRVAPDDSMDGGLVGVALGAGALGTAGVALGAGALGDAVGTADGTIVPAGLAEHPATRTRQPIARWIAVNFTRHSISVGEG